MMIQAVLGQHQGLTPGGWIVMIGCIGFVCCLMCFCFYRVLFGAQQNRDAEEQ